VKGGNRSGLIKRRKEKTYSLNAEGKMNATFSDLMPSLGEKHSKPRIGGVQLTETLGSGGKPSPFRGRGPKGEERKKRLGETI